MALPIGNAKNALSLQKLMPLNDLLGVKHIGVGQLRSGD
jgi:hypothetical protein